MTKNCKSRNFSLTVENEYNLGKWYLINQNEPNFENIIDQTFVENLQDVVYVENMVSYLILKIKNTYILDSFGDNLLYIFGKYQII